MVILPPSLPLPDTTPGSQCATVSSRESRCSAANCRTTVATNVLVALPMRNSSSARTGAPVAMSASPAVAYTDPRGPITSASTPTVPVCWTTFTCPCKASWPAEPASAGGMNVAVRSAVASIEVAAARKVLIIG